MITYTGTKTLKATPMTLGDYNKLRGWDMPLDEDPKRDGYLVEYPLLEGDKPNHSSYEGYISWSPKQTFEQSYKVSETFADRLLIEVQAEASNLNKLNQFMASDTFPTLEVEDKDLMYSQQRVMSRFVQILGKRLKRVGVTFKH